MVDSSVKIVKQGRIVREVGGGLRGPKTVDVVARHPDSGGTEIRARITLLDGVYEVTDIRLMSLETRPIPPEALRQIPLRTLVRSAVGPVLRELNRDKLAPLGDPELRSAEATRLGSAAHIYRLALAVGDAPTKAIQDVLGCSHAYASRIVTAAREAGYLREDEVGHAGGARSRLGE